MAVRPLHRSLVAALAAALVCASTPAAAGRSPGVAAQEGEKATSAVPLSNDPELEYRLGTQAYALGNYEQAVAHFERSYALSNHPYLLYNLGLSYHQWHGLSGDIGHLRKARRLFQNYLKALAEDPKMDQEQREDAEAAIARIDEEIAALEAKQQPATTPAEGPRETETTKVTAPEPSPDPAPGTDEPPPTKKPIYRRGWFWGVVTVGILAIAGGVTAGVLMRRGREDKGPELGTIGPTQGSAPTGLGFRF